MLKKKTFNFLSFQFATRRRNKFFKKKITLLTWGVVRFFKVTILINKNEKVMQVENIFHEL